MCIRDRSAYCADVAFAYTVLYFFSSVPMSYVVFVSGAIAFEVSVPLLTNVPIVLAPELVTFPATSPVTAPVSGPENDVAVAVPETCSLVLGVVVPIPTLDSEPSMVITVVVTPPSFTLKVMSVLFVVFDIIPPDASTVMARSLSIPTTSPASLAILMCPDVVSLALDLR